jgi:hypothetical protein
LFFSRNEENEKRLGHNKHEYFGSLKSLKVISVLGLPKKNEGDWIGERGNL